MKLTEIKPSEKNPRQITKDKLQKLQKSISEFGKMMELRPIVVDTDGNILGGNMRYRAIKALGYSEIPNNWVKVADGLTEEEKRRFVIEDNVGFGEWDWDVLANEWDDLPLADWGVDVPNVDVELTENEDGNTFGETEKNEEAERLLNEAMQQYCGEFADQVDIMMEHGSIATGMTEGLAKLKFIRAKYYGEKYPRKMSLIFTPKQFYTAGTGTSIYETMRESNPGKAGIQSFRTLSNDDNLTKIFGTGLAINAGRMPLDFPVEVARELLRSFAKGGDVLDPCHGWGGRCVAAMLEDVRTYTGIDPSPVAHDGVERIKYCFRSYSRTAVQLIAAPFEDVELQEESFDFALTSPPYFDVEKYDWEESSRKRYNQYENWVRGFYEPLIKNTIRALKKGGAFALQVGTQTYPLKDDAFRIAEECGIRAELYKEDILHNTQHKTEEDKSEVIILLYK